LNSEARLLSSSPSCNGIGRRECSLVADRQKEAPAFSRKKEFASHFFIIREGERRGKIGSLCPAGSPSGGKGREDGGLPKLLVFGGRGISIPRRTYLFSSAEGG